MDYNQEALDMHKRLKGKLEVKSKIELNSKDDLSIAYTPGVAEVCKKIFENPNLVYDYTIKANTVAVISDGSSVLGLGNIGAEASLPVMEGKSILFKEFAGIDAFPICLDTQDPKEIIQTIKNIAPVFGGINLEDFKAPQCFEIEDALQDLGIPVMHDDQHGTAVVVLAGMINAIKLAKKNKEDVKILINGAGAAGIAVTNLLLKYGFSNIIMLDSKGIISKDRDDLNLIKSKILEVTNDDNVSGDLSTAIKGIDIFIGVSKANVLTKEMVSSMNDKPIIFAMANPIPEIMPEDAKDAGVFIIATGRSDFANQVNNVLAFPGIFRGALDIKAKRITTEMKLAAADAIASLVSDLNVDNIIPSPLNKEVSIAVAEAVKGAYVE